MSVRSLRYNTIEQHFTKGVTASTDRDALAFLEAAQIYNTNQQRAIVNLVRSLKRVGLWSKMKAIYPFVGGTASSHKWNLKDPRDADAAFRLSFQGGWTHSANGGLPNGTNAYGDTFLNAATVLSGTSNHLSYYSRTNNTTATAEFRAWIAGPYFLQLRVAVNYASGLVSTGTTVCSFSTTNNSTGYWLGATRSSTNREAYRNGISESERTSNTDSSNLPGLNLYLACGNNSGTADFFSNKECAFATIGDGLTDTDATNLYNIVDLYQKRLGRAV